LTFFILSCRFGLDSGFDEIEVKRCWLRRICGPAFEPGAGVIGILPNRQETIGGPAFQVPPDRPLKIPGMATDPIDIALECIGEYTQSSHEGGDLMEPHEIDASDFVANTLKVNRAVLNRQHAF